MSFAESIRTWSIRRNITAANRILEDIRLASLYRLQLEFDIPSLDDLNEIDRTELLNSINNFYDWRLSSEICTELNPESSFLYWLCNDKESKSLRESNFRVSHWCTTSEADRAEIEQTFRDVFQYDMSPLTETKILKQRREFEKWRKSIHRQLKDSRGFKVDFHLKDFAMVIPLLSVAFVCAGYLHTSIVYKHFGIDPTRFFSIGDYLASSLEQIRLVLFVLIAFTVGAIYGFRRNSTITRYQRETGKRKILILKNFRYNLGVCALLFAYFAWDYVATIPGKDAFLLICLFFVFESPLARLVNRYFKNAQSAYAVLLVLIVFFASIFVGAETRIAQIESDQTRQEYQIISQQKSYTHNNSKLIGANSKYMFILDWKDRVEVVPLSQIDRAIFGGNQISAKRKFPADTDGP